MNIYSLFIISNVNFDYIFFYDNNLHVIKQAEM